MANLVALGYGLGVTVVVLFGLLATAYAIWRQIKHGQDTAEFFLTARKSVKTFTIGWSFYAAAMGSWALFGPAGYCLYAGVLGTIIYAIFSGFPLIVVAWLGSIIHDLVPDVLSMSDFVRRRFGLGVSLFVAVIVIFNMSIAMTAEYTAVGDLFEYVLGAPRWPIVVIIGVVAMLYTAAGGLYVSIITDQWQALTSVVVVAIIFIYTCVTFREPLGPLPSYMSWDNYYGLAAIGVMPISLISATLFSEAMWQRCWASEDRRTLMLGATMGCVAVIIVVFLLGFGGVLVVWSGLYEQEGANNVILFNLLRDDWIIILVAILSVTMSESAIDSLQNAIVDTFATSLSAIANAVLLRRRVGPQGTSRSAAVEDLVNLKSGTALWIIRGLVLILNVAPIVVSLQGFNILQLFLLANLITTAAVIPIMGGLYQGPYSRQIFTPLSAVVGVFTGISPLFWWAAVAYPTMPYSEALWNVFLYAYDYPPFLLALGFSMVGIALGAGVEAAVRHYWKLEYPAFSLKPTEETGGESVGVLEEGKETKGEEYGDSSKNATSEGDSDGLLQQEAAGSTSVA